MWNAVFHGGGQWFARPAPKPEVPPGSGGRAYPGMKFFHQYQTQGHTAVTSTSGNGGSLSAPHRKWTATAVNKLEKDVNNLYMAAAGPACDRCYIIQCRVHPINLGCYDHIALKKDSDSFYYMPPE